MANEVLASRERTTKRCPKCGEEILAVAVKCKFCRSEIDIARSGPTPIAAVEPVAGPPYASSFTPVAAGEASAPLLAEMSAGAIIGFSIITLGIYGLVKFYKTGIAYQKLAGRPSNFAGLFWVQVIAGPIVTVILSAIGGLPGVLAYVGTVVVGVMVVLELLRLREDIVRARRIDVPLTGSGALAALWFAGFIPLVGLVTVTLALVFFCQDNNRIAAALQRQTV
jgi:hypothetical protein